MSDASEHAGRGTKLGPQSRLVHAHQVRGDRCVQAEPVSQKCCVGGQGGQCTVQPVASPGRAPTPLGHHLPQKDPAGCHRLRAAQDRVPAAREIPERPLHCLGAQALIGQSHMRVLQILLLVQLHESVEVASATKTNRAGFRFR